MHDEISMLMNGDDVNKRWREMLQIFTRWKKAASDIQSGQV